MLKFITADERMKRAPGIKMVILGPAKIGKTSLLWTLDAASTLFVDMEAGDLSVDGWQGPSIDVRKQAIDMGAPSTWDFLRALACWIGGPNPSASAGEPYSQQHYETVCTQMGDPSGLEPISTIFFDSITVASRDCFAWARTQPRAFSEKTGKPDIRGAYGLLGQEMVAFLTQLQHARGKNVIFVGLMDNVKDDFGRSNWVPQIEGGATARALAGIVDQIISMVEIDFGDGGKHRAFVTQSLNEYGYPAGDRAGQLDPIEEPHLGKVIEKIRAGGRQRALAYALPASQPAPETTPEPETVETEAAPAEPEPAPVSTEPAPGWASSAPSSKPAGGPMDDEIPF